MRDFDSNYKEQSDAFEILQRFRESLENGRPGYFDVNDFDDIIDYLISEGDFDMAETALQHALDIHPGALSLRIRLVQSLINNGDANTALSELQTIVLLDSQNAEVFLLKGAALLILEEEEEAADNFEKAIQLAGQDADDILYHIGSSFISYGDQRRAVGYLERAFQHNPDNEMVLYDLGYFHDQLGSPENSIHYYNLYLDIDPFNASVWFNL